LPLKIIKIKPSVARAAFIAAAVICVFTGWYFIKWDFANSVASRLEIRRPESKIVADWLTGVAPDDPQTHYAAAVILEKTLDPDDLTRSLKEYETAAALSPNNFQMWLDLGKARNQSGDADGALAAFRRALELAPNYAAVQWVYGNSLVRQGQTDEGFAHIAAAAAANADYARPAVITAVQIFDGDTGRVRQSLGDTDTTNAALANTLAEQGRFDEAYEAWEKLPPDAKVGKLRPIGESLRGQMAAAKMFRLAARIATDLAPPDGEKPVIAQIGNGGFENGVKLRNAGLFEWQIAEGAQPQIGLAEGQAHSGRYSLWLIFNTFETAGWRAVSQTVAVDEGVQYEFEMYYRSDLKTSSTLKWEIADAASTAPMANTPPMVPAADWTPVRVRFTVPGGGDGIIIRLAREGCIGPACPMNGKLSFDDFSLRRL
jgi:tetratricopeptide (TPR) repeat protein